MDSLSDREENLPEFEEELEGKGEVSAATELRLVYSLPIHYSFSLPFQIQ